MQHDTFNTEIKSDPITSTFSDLEKIITDDNNLLELPTLPEQNIIDTDITVEDVIKIIDEDDYKKKLNDLIFFTQERWIQLISIINILKPNEPLLIDYTNDIAHIYNTLNTLQNNN